MTLYLDVIWLLNWLFDCLLLSWTAVLLKRRAPVWKLAIGGFIGSLIIILEFTRFSNLAGHPAVKILFSFFMILSVFGFSRIKTFVKAAACLYFVTFLSGGILLGMHYLFESQVLSAHPGMAAGINRFGDPVSWIYILIGFPLAWQYSKHTISSIEMSKIAYDQMVEVTIHISQFTCKVNGFVDSGNQLYDPLTGSPVMIVSLCGMEKEVPEDMLGLFKNSRGLLENDGNVYTWSDRLRIVPCKVVGHDHQLLTAVKPDSVKISRSHDSFTITKCLISFTLQQLSPDNAYQCIVHPKMLTGARDEHAS